jgi:2,3-bisphosphoglycerate-independent phosphoglycerate mutase
LDVTEIWETIVGRDSGAVVHVIMDAMRASPSVTNLQPDVPVVTGDHSTPTHMGEHTRHPVPLVIRSRFARVDAFHEEACLRGSFGIRPRVHLMGPALAHAGRMGKYGG